MSIRRIVSGGQTGVDRAALNFAIERDISGWCPPQVAAPPMVFWMTAIAFAGLSPPAQIPEPSPDDTADPTVMKEALDGGTIMYVWKYDEDKCIFCVVTTADLSADPDGFYVTRRARYDDTLTVREGGTEQPFPEEGVLTVAGATFDRDDFVPVDQPRLSDEEIANLRAEMERDGLWAREQLRAWRALYVLSDYPLLSALASARNIAATKLDGRTCRHFYAEAEAAGTLDVPFSAHELALMRALGVEPAAAKSLVAVVHENGHLIARMSGGRVLRHHDAMELADLLIAAGVSADDVRIPDWRDLDVALEAGERIAVFHRMRQTALRMRR